MTTALKNLIAKLRAIITDLKDETYGPPDEIDTEALIEDISLTLEEYQEEMEKR